MGTVKILLIPNMSQFLGVIDRCVGRILVELPEAGLCDLKRDTSVRGVLRLMNGQSLEEGLSLTLTDKADLPILLDYMASASR